MNLKLIENRINKVSVVLGFIGSTILLMNPIFQKTTSTEDISYFFGQFDKIEKLHADRLIGKEPSYYYDIKLLEYNQIFRIGADYVDCFKYSAFETEVQIGDPIKIGLTKKDGIFRNGSIAVVSNKKKEYFDINCRNSEINKSKIIGPLFGGIGMIAFIIMFISLRKKNTEPNTRL